LDATQPNDPNKVPGTVCMCQRLKAELSCTAVMKKGQLAAVSRVGGLHVHFEVLMRPGIPEALLCTTRLLLLMRLTSPVGVVCWA
jgi:hypothetical protein